MCVVVGSLEGSTIKSQEQFPRRGKNTLGSLQERGKERSRAGARNFSELFKGELLVPPPKKKEEKNSGKRQKWSVAVEPFSGGRKDLPVSFSQVFNHNVVKFTRFANTLTSPEGQKKFLRDYQGG